MSDHLKITELCDIVLRHIEHEFSNEIASLYFGDIVIYPPNAFRDRRNQWAPVIAVYPRYNRKVEGQETMNSALRIYGIQILVMVNYTPYISVPPEEAMGERMLSEMAERIMEYFAKPENLHFDHRVQLASITDVDWAWNPRLDQPIRGAEITYEVSLRVPRN